MLDTPSSGQHTGRTQDTMAPTAAEKAEKAEAESAANIKLALKVVKPRLPQGEGARHQLNVRVVDQYIVKLESGLTAHEKAITELVVAAGDDEARIDELTTKMSSLMDETNPVLDQLFSIQEALKAADASPAASQASKKGFVSVQLKIRMAKQTLETRLNLLQDASKKEEVLASLPMIQAKLKQLDELDVYSQSELDAILSMVASEDLKDADVSSFQTDLSSLIDDSALQISTLKERFSEAAALLQEQVPVAEVTSSATLTEQIAREMATIRADLESRSATRSSSDFCFAKVQVPDFKGDVKEFTKWRSQVEDYLKEVAKKSTQKAAVHMLDRLTPRHIDVSRCDNLTEAWAKLSSKFGSPTHIARLILRDFTGTTLKKHTDEAKLIELRDVLEKLESDLLTNGQEARCNDFTLLDHAESIIPGRFRDQFAEVKDDLITDRGTGFKALTSFLEDKATMVERHLPERLLDSEPKGKKRPDSHQDEIEELRAKIAALEGRAEQQIESNPRPVFNKEVSEKKSGKCPICDEYHYFKSKRGPSEGQDLASPCLHTCPKFRDMNLGEKTDAIITYKACAACTDWRHERPSCPSKTEKPCKEDGCTANHHTSLHGSNNPKVMALRTKTSPSNQSHPDSKNRGLLAMLHYTFKKVNQGTVVFIDEGSETSAISTKLARALFLHGDVKLTTVTKAFEKRGQTVDKTHHVVELTDRLGKKHEVTCMEVDYITDVQEQPDYSKVYEMFPHLPHGCLQRPEMEVGLLLGQNATGLLPTGGGGRDCLDNLRVRQTILGEHGWVLEGRHPSISFSYSKLKTNSLRVSLNKISVTIPTDLPRSRMKMMPADPPTHPEKKGDHIQLYLQSLLMHNLPETTIPPNSLIGRVVEAAVRMIKPPLTPTMALDGRARSTASSSNHTRNQVPDAVPVGNKKNPAKHLWPPSKAPAKHATLPPLTSHKPRPNTGKPYRIPQRRGSPPPKSDPLSKIWGGKADLSPIPDTKDLEEFDMREAEILTDDDLPQAKIAPDID